MQLTEAVPWGRLASEYIITKRTTSSLPPEQTLVRASTLAPSQYEAELLRAAQYGEETPVEELLRAGQPNDQG